VGATDLVLRMIEAGAIMRDLTLDNAIRAIREVSHDMTGRSRVPLASGRELSALDIQYEYLNRARDFAGNTGADPVSMRVLDMWERALGAIETGNLDLIAREVDWVTKYQLIERYRARHDLPLSSPRVAQLDLAYHDVHRGRGLYYLLQRAGRARGSGAGDISPARCGGISSARSPRPSGDASNLAAAQGTQDSGI
jgi:proteasome accessory factor A